jgi:hypothetical protein
MRLTRGCVARDHRIIGNIARLLDLQLGGGAIYRKRNTK